MSENRIRPKLYRVTPEVDALVRAYAEAHGITPNEAAERLIQGKRENGDDAARLTAELASAQEALAASLDEQRKTVAGYDQAIRERDEEIARLHVEAANAKKGAALTLDPDLDKRIAERALRKGWTKEEVINRALVLAMDRYESVDKYESKKPKKGVQK